MVSQIFKSRVSPVTLYTFLDECAEDTDGIYIFSNVEYKRAKYKNLVVPFCLDIENNYYNSKKYYPKNAKTYKKFATVLRQICKSHGILFDSTVKYSNSDYNVSYIISIVREP